VLSCLIIASITDLRDRIIPNPLVLFLVLLGVLHLLIAPDVRISGLRVLWSIVVIGFFLLTYYLSFTGPGDVKLVAAVIISVDVATSIPIPGFSQNSLSGGMFIIFFYSSFQILRFTINSISNLRAGQLKSGREIHHLKSIGDPRWMYLFLLYRISSINREREHRHCKILNPGLFSSDSTCFIQPLIPQAPVFLIIFSLILFVQQGQQVSSF
jgi:Flp pilus assembly protein protease CpaA